LQTPVANRYAERWVGSVRRECLDWLIILGRRHLEHARSEYVDHHNRARPHRGLDLRPPTYEEAEISPDGDIVCRNRLGGLIHEYSRDVRQSTYAKVTARRLATGKVWPPTTTWSWVTG